jgi:hypothetical protein
MFSIFIKMKSESRFQFSFLILLRLNKNWLKISELNHFSMRSMIERDHFKLFNKSFQSYLVSWNITCMKRSKILRQEKQSESLIIISKYWNNLKSKEYVSDMFYWCIFKRNCHEIVQVMQNYFGFFFIGILWTAFQICTSRSSVI